jgi:hypothetical protein
LNASTKEAWLRSPPSTKCDACGTMRHGRAGRGPLAGGGGDDPLSDFLRRAGRVVGTGGEDRSGAGEAADDRGLRRRADGLGLLRVDVGADCGLRGEIRLDRSVWGPGLWDGARGRVAGRFRCATFDGLERSRAESRGRERLRPVFARGLKTLSRGDQAGRGRAPRAVCGTGLVEGTVEGTGDGRREGWDRGRDRTRVVVGS